jgi:hypothetical protein
MTAPNRREALATNNQTLGRLQCLEALYRQGYRSDAIDTMDVVEWSIFCEMWESVRERLALLEEASIPWGLGCALLKA